IPTTMPLNFSALFNDNDNTFNVHSKVKDKLIEDAAAFDSGYTSDEQAIDNMAFQIPVNSVTPLLNCKGEMIGHRHTLVSTSATHEDVQEYIAGPKSNSDEEILTNMTVKIRAGQHGRLQRVTAQERAISAANLRKMRFQTKMGLEEWEWAVFDPTDEKEDPHNNVWRRCVGRTAGSRDDTRPWWRKKGLTKGWQYTECGVHDSYAQRVRKFGYARTEEPDFCR
ncbi:hypothetical protein LTR66_015076, partial [Elasticomyces elasticus]